MERKKVQTENNLIESTKKRDDENELSDIESVRWDKIINVSGKIIRYKLGDREKSIEIGNMVLKGEAKKLYSAIDGDHMYFYYTINNIKK